MVYLHTRAGIHVINHGGPNREVGSQSGPFFMDTGNLLHMSVNRRCEGSGILSVPP